MFIKEKFLQGYPGTCMGHPAPYKSKNNNK